MLISDQDPPKTESTGLKNGRKCLKLINHIKKKKKRNGRTYVEVELGAKDWVWDGGA